MSSAFEDLAEKKILEAIDDGLFLNLEGSGQPIDQDAYFATPAHLRMSYNILKSGGFVPPEVAMMQEIESLEQQLLAEENLRSLKKLETQLSYKKSELAMAIDRLRMQSPQSLENQAW